MAIIKQCAHCGTQFKTDQQHAVFCGQVCKKAVANLMRKNKRGLARDTLHVMNAAASRIEPITVDKPPKQGETLNFATLDFETDPFFPGREVSPFAYGLLLDNGTYFSAWDTDSDVIAIGGLIKHLMAVIDSLTDDYIIYAHNGGRFDFLFMLDELYNGVPVAELSISPREGKTPLVKATRQSGFFMIGNRVTRIEYKTHQFRDSYAIIPVPLKSSGSKLDIDYTKMEKNTRDANRKEIDDYLNQDCVALLDMVTTYAATFTRNGKMPLTMAGAAFKELTKTLIALDKSNGGKGKPFDPLNTRQDKKFRSFYVGGRTQPFFSGIVNAPDGLLINLFDVVSEYPSVMKLITHPIGNEWYEKHFITEETFFVTWLGWSYGAMPVKTEFGVDFPNVLKPEAPCRFNSTIHEFNKALELGLIEVDSIIVTHNCASSTTFADFVDEFFNRRVYSAECTQLADKVVSGSKLTIREYRFLIKAIRAESLVGKISHEMLEKFSSKHNILVLFWKLVLNSSYGKWGQNAENFGNYHIVEKGSDGYYYLLNFRNGTVTPIESPVNGKEYVFIKIDMDEDELSKQAIYNVATAASITGAARALLMDGINACNVTGADALYVDTDSVFTFGMPSPKSVTTPNGLNIVKDKTLGAWNHEASGTIMALAGKKNYALFDKPASAILENPTWKKAFKQFHFKGETLEMFATRFSDKELGLYAVKGFADIPVSEDDEGNHIIERWACNKMASKGSRISPQAMVNMAYDKTASTVYPNPAPTFDLAGKQSFITRTIRNTSKKTLYQLGKSLKKVPVIAKGLNAIYDDE